MCVNTQLCLYEFDTRICLVRCELKKKRNLLETKLGRLKQKDSEFGVILSYIASSSPVWTT